MINKTALAAYILHAMMTWVPPSQQPGGEDVEARYRSIAADIADVAADPSEPGLFAAPSGLSESLQLEVQQVMNATQLAAIASYESGYARFVDLGQCNDPTYKADGRGGCDGRAAWSIWQIHTMGGLVLTDKEFVGRWYAKDLSHVINGPDLIRDRKLAARIALHILRYSMNHTHSLCQYTGETTDGVCWSRTPLADARRFRAADWVTKHPWPVKMDGPVSAEKQ